MAIAAQNFPGVYTRITDDSFIEPTRSRFRLGLIGVARRGAFDQVIPVRTAKDFIRNFGTSIPNQYMAVTASILTALSDGLSIVRVGRRYESIVLGGATGTSGDYTVTFTTPEEADRFNVNDYVRVRQNGLPTTVNAKVSAKNTSGPYTITLVSIGAEAVALAATYTSAAVDRSPVSGAANEAESFLSSYTYAAIPAVGTASGDKNAFEFEITGDPSTLAVGDLLKLVETDKVTTREVRVKEVRGNVSLVGGTILLEPANIGEIGYQALPLQDAYAAATITRKLSTATAIHMKAASAGTWANTSGSTGLRVQVSPGSAPGTKKILVFEDSALVETIDNLSEDPDSADFYTTRINGNSAEISIVISGSFPFEPPSNTIDPWNLSAATPLNIATFAKGFNGEAASSADFIGTINPVDDSATGLKLFEDSDNVDISFMYAPGNVDISVAQEMRRIANARNASGILDVPSGLNSRQAVDWHNGAGLFSSRGRLDTYNLAVYWNWITVVDPFTSEQISVPPGIGALRAMAYTHDREKPWYAAAGEVRGLIPEALAVEFDRLGAEAKAAMYGLGNSVNPILLSRDRIMVFGDRTLQRAESKLTAQHSVVLVNHIVNGLAALGRKYIFDPNDEELLSAIRLDFNTFMKSIQADRGVEEYSLVIDETNNTPDSRNRREVNVDLSIIPTDTMERLFINALVRESGAQIVNVG